MATYGTLLSELLAREAKFIASKAKALGTKSQALDFKLKAAGDEAAELRAQAIVDGCEANIIECDECIQQITTMKTALRLEMSLKSKEVSDSQPAN